MLTQWRHNHKPIQRSNRHRNHDACPDGPPSLSLRENHQHRLRHQSNRLIHHLLLRNPVSRSANANRGRIHRSRRWTQRHHTHRPQRYELLQRPSLVVRSMRRSFRFVMRKLVVAKNCVGMGSQEPSAIRETWGVGVASRAGHVAAVPMPTRRPAAAPPDAAPRLTKTAQARRNPGIYAIDRSVNGQRSTFRTTRLRWSTGLSAIQPLSRAISMSASRLL